MSLASSGIGLSPRWRGNLNRWVTDVFRARSIPALAGQPLNGAVPTDDRKVYPRAGGATATALADMELQVGLSPRWRGNLIPAPPGPAGAGSIPALAGQP